MKTRCWQQSNPHPVRGRAGWRFCPLLADLLLICSPHSDPTAQLLQQFLAPWPSPGATAPRELQGPGTPTQQRGPSLGHPGAAASLLLVAARHEDWVAFIPVNQPPGCWVPCDEGGTGVACGERGTGWVLTSLCSRTTGKGAGGSLLAFPAPHGQDQLSHPTLLPRTEMDVFGGNCVRDLGLNDVSGKSDGDRC